MSTTNEATDARKLMKKLQHARRMCDRAVKKSKRWEANKVRWIGKVSELEVAVANLVQPSLFSPVSENEDHRQGSLL